MQNCVQDLFDTIFLIYVLWYSISTYNTTLISLIINYGDTSTFCMHGIHDTSYDTTIMTSLREKSTRQSCGPVGRTPPQANLEDTAA
jgi:hypothetical protein